MPTKIDIGPKLYLDSIRKSDVESFVRYLNDIEIYRNTCSIPNPYTQKDALAFLRLVRDFEKVNEVQREWAIRLKEKDELIGCIGLLYNDGVQSHKSEFGYWLGRPFWNKGIMSDVVSKFADHCLHNIGLVRLSARVFSHNDKSMRVLEKAGFEREGLIRKDVKKDGVYLDSYIFSRIK